MHLLAVVMCREEIILLRVPTRRLIEIIIEISVLWGIHTCIVRVI